MNIDEFKANHGKPKYQTVERPLMRGEREGLTLNEKIDFYASKDLTAEDIAKVLVERREFVGDFENALTPYYQSLLYVTDYLKSNPKHMRKH